MNNGRILGLRSFLLTLLELNSQGIKEECEFVETNIPKGIATELYRKYSDFFDHNAFNNNSLVSIDEYYKQWTGCADGEEFRHYSCTKTDGIALLIALALNDIY